METILEHEPAKGERVMPEAIAALLQREARFPSFLSRREVSPANDCRRKDAPKPAAGALIPKSLRSRHHAYPLFHCSRGSNLVVDHMD